MVTCKQNDASFLWVARHLGEMSRVRDLDETHHWTAIQEVEPVAVLVVDGSFQKAVQHLDVATARTYHFRLELDYVLLEIVAGFAQPQHAHQETSETVVVDVLELVRVFGVADSNDGLESQQIRCLVE